MHQHTRSDTGGVHKQQIGKNVSKKDKINFLVNTVKYQFSFVNAKKSYLEKLTDVEASRTSKKKLNEHG